MADSHHHSAFDLPLQLRRVHDDAWIDRDRALLNHDHTRVLGVTAMWQTQAQ